MIKILNCKNLNYLSRLRAILEKRRSKSKINTDITIETFATNLDNEENVLDLRLKV